MTARTTNPGHSDGGGERLIESSALREREPDLVQGVLERRSARRRLPRLRPLTLVGVLATLVVLAGAAVMHGWNLLRSPGPNDDEGTYVSQAWVFDHFGELSHYTYWYDHPPAGWMLLSGWNRVLAATAGIHDVWTAGRMAMLALLVVSCALIVVLLRRLGVALWACLLAVVWFVLSPIAWEWHRLTLLDNIGTPFVLLAWVLALSPRRHMSAYAASGVMLGLAVLVRETNLLFAPAILLQVIISAGAARRYALAVWGALLGSVVAFYPLYAVIKNELVPGQGHVSLIGAVLWQLFTRASSGSVLVAGSDANRIVAGWWEQDPYLLVATGLGVVVIALLRRRAAAVAVTALIIAATPLRGGYLPAPYPINLVWPCVLVVGVAMDTVVRRAADLAARRGPWGTPVAAVATATIMLAAIAPGFANAVTRDRETFTRSDRTAHDAARDWISTHASPDQVFLVDNTTWIDLVQTGRPREKVIWFTKLDADPEVSARYPNRWKDVDYAVVSDLMRAAASDSPSTLEAIRTGHVVADFGAVKIYGHE